MAAPAAEREGSAPPMWQRRGWKARAVLTARRGLSLVLVFLATLAGGYLVLAGFHERRELSVGEVRLAVDPGHRGALDVYVPLVDWGARFEAIRAPLRLRIDLQTVNRQVATSIARGAPFNVDRVREEATDALASYIRKLIVLTFLASLSLGLLVAFAIRSRVPRLRWTAAVAGAASGALMIALIVLIPPRGEIANPQYYAHGPDIPRALEAVEAAQRTTGILDQELDAQLVGLARLVLDPGRRRSLAGEPVITVASDLHNNTFGLGVLERLAGDGPVFFAGDLTDRGSPLETSLVRRIAHTGGRFVFVSGNHDSDFLSRELAAEGAIVLTRQGRMRSDGKVDGPLVVEIDGLRVAGYDDPFERKSVDGFADRFEGAPNPAMKEEFLRWLLPLIGRVDIVMVHEPALIETALEVLRDAPPERPLVFVVGHTHSTDLRTMPGVTVINGGSIGAGGTGNLAEDTHMSLARFVYTMRPRFQPLAADLVSIDPGTGSSSARRIRLDPEVP